MADNTELPGTGEIIADKDIGGVKFQKMILTDEDGDFWNVGNPVPVTFGAVSIGTVDVASIAAGDNNIGNVDIASIAAGNNNIGNVDIVTMPDVTIGTNAALVAGTALIGKVGIDQTTPGTTNLVSAGQSGAWNIGTVSSIGNALPAGNNNIGDVDVASIAAGDNNIGNVDIVTMPNVVIGSGTVTTVSTVTSVTAIANALPAGDNNIGNVDIVSMPDIAIAGADVHDAPVTGNPLLVGGYAKATAPTDVSGDGDAVNAWHLRNGAAATVITAAGALIPGDASNGLDVDVTRLPALVAGTAIIGKVAIDQTTDGTTNLVAAKQSGTWNVGTVTAVTSLTNALPAGTNNIGDVDVLTLPNVTLAAGTNTNEVVGDVAHDAPAAGNPVLMGGYAKAAAPSDVSGDADAVNAWFLRNGAQATVLTAAGALIGGDATNGLDVDVTRMSALVAGSAVVGKVGIDQTTPGTTNLVAVSSISSALPAGTNAIGKLAANSGVDIGDVDVTSVPTDPFGANADAASATGSISAKLKGMATALGVTALDLGSGTGGSRTLRTYPDTAAVHSTRPLSQQVTCSTDVTLPTSTIYSINDAISDSTSSPTAGGFTFTGAARSSGGSGIITDAVFTTSADAGTLLQGEIWLFNTSVTAINDNAVFAVSDAEIKTCVGKIAFTMEDAGNNGFYHATGLNIGFTCSGSANLRFLIKAKNAYTPATDVLTFVLKIVQDG